MARKQILILTGSPRVNGNSDRMAMALKEGAERAGHQVEIFRTADKHIKGCLACESCWGNGKPCIFEDDCYEMFPLLESADVIVYASPLYWFTFPMQLKAAIDKMYPYAGNRGSRPLKVRESLLLVAAGDDDPTVFRGIIGTYHEIAKYMKWSDRGVLAIPGVHKLDDIGNTDGLEKAAQLGELL